VLDSVADKFSGEKLAVLSINSDHNVNTINRVLEKVNTSVPVLRDAECEVFEAYRAEVIPTLYLIDQQGKIYSSWTGPAKDLEVQLTKNISSMLKSQIVAQLEKSPALTLVKDE